MTKEQLTKKIATIEVWAKRANHFTWVGVAALLVGIFYSPLYYPAIVLWALGFSGIIYYSIRYAMIKHKLEKIV